MSSQLVYVTDTLPVESAGASVLLSFKAWQTKVLICSKRVLLHAVLNYFEIFYFFLKNLKWFQNSSSAPIGIFCIFWLTLCSRNKLTLILQARACGLESTWLYWFQVTFQVTCNTHGMSFIALKMCQTIKHNPVENHNTVWVITMALNN